MTAAPGGISVLHVDDEPDFAEMAAEFVERRNDRIQVETAASVEAALERLTDGTFDCVVSDYDMPGQDGIELLETVRDEHPDLPFILYTGKGSEEVASRAITRGVTDYLQKETGVGQYTVLANRITNAVSQHRAEEELRASEERYHRLIDDAPVPILLYSSDLEIVYANAAAADFLNAEDTAELLGSAAWRFVHPDNEETVKQRLERVGTARETAEMTEQPVLAADGTVKHAVVSSSPGYYDGEPVIQTVAYDVTDRKERQRQLEWERDRFSAIIEAIPDPVAHVRFEDGEPIAEIVNAAFAETFGYAPEEIRDRSVNELIVPEGHLDEARDIDDTVRNRQTVRQEVERLAVDGPRTFWFRSRRFELPDGDVESVGIYIDVSERKEREQKLSTLHGVADDLTRIDSVDRVCERTIEASEAILEFDLSAIDIEEAGVLRKRAVSEDVPADNMTDMPVEQGIAGKTYRTGESFVIDDLPEHDEGNPQGPYRSLLSVPLGDHGIFQAAAKPAAAFDEADLELAELLTSHTESALDRIEHQGELERQNERLEEFASVVSHDLQNPLTVARGRLELASEDVDNEHLEAVADAHDRMATLIEDVLSLARAGETVGEPEAVDLAALTDDCWSHVEAGTAELVNETDGTVQADRGSLRQLLANLFRNAVEHGGPDATVSVGMVPGGFFVEDDGPGVPRDKREEIFEPGFTTSGTGAGIGLSIVRDIAVAHGWSIEVSTGQRGGARFEATGVDIHE